MEKKKEFILETISNQSTGELSVKDFGNTLKLAIAILTNEDSVKPHELTDKADRKAMYDFRAICNKTIKAIDRKRIDTIADFTMDFTTQCNQIKDLFQKRVDEFTDCINEYDAKTKVKEAKEGKTTIIVKTSNKEAIEKLKQFCIYNNCEMTIKE